MSKDTKHLTYGISSPRIHLNYVQMSNGQYFDSMWFTVEQAKELINVLTKAVEEYKNVYK
jgi:hypothetical protein